MLAYIGMILIIAGWIMQIMHLKKDQNLCIKFVVLYSLGVFLLVIDGFWDGFTVLGLLNLASLVAALAVLKKLKCVCECECCKPKKTPMKGKRKR